jgi:hypothetical protein
MPLLPPLYPSLQTLTSHLVLPQGPASEAVILYPQICLHFVHTTIVLYYTLNVSLFVHKKLDGRTAFIDKEGVT